MSGRNKAKKAKIEIEKPELPKFLQRIKEQIVANERQQQRERAEARRRAQPDVPDDDPTIVQVGADDLSEAEFKRLRTEYRYGEETRRDRKHNSQELDIDLIMSSARTGIGSAQAGAAASPSGLRGPKSNAPSGSGGRKAKSEPTDRAKPVDSRKVLSYDTSSGEEED